MRHLVKLSLLFYLLVWHNIGYASDYPKRIVSLGPSITEGLYLLGAGDRIVGVTTYCIKPPQAKKKEKIGSVTEVDVEKIANLKPDLVIATSLTSQKAKEKLKGLGIKVVDFSLPGNFSDLCEKFLMLGRIVGKGSEAEDIVIKANREIDTIRNRLKGLPKPKVFIQVGARPLFTMTKDSFVNDLIELAGGINIAGEARGGLYSREKVIEQNPDVIIIMTMGIVGEEEKRIWQRYRTLKAVRDNRIYIMDSYKIGSPTPVTFVETLKEMAGLLHPEVFVKKSGNGLDGMGNF